MNSRIIPTKATLAAFALTIFLLVIFPALQVSAASPRANTDLSAATISLIRTYSSPNGQTDGEFGDAVAVSGKYILIGAFSETASGHAGAGRAYLFNESGTLLETFTSPNSQTDGAFGSSVALNSKEMIIGAAFETSDKLTDAGNAYIFTLGGALVKSLSSPNPVSYGSFGSSVALSSSYAIVGAYGEEASSSPGSGHVYVYNTTGSLKHTLSSPNANAQDYGSFGTAVATYGKYVVVGAPDEYAYGEDLRYGHSYIFNASSASLLETLTSPHPVTGTFFSFGVSVAISGSTVVIGADGENVSNKGDAGQAYVYNTGGKLLHSLQSESPQTNGFFGYSVSVGTSYIAIGAYDESSKGESAAGNVYMYNISGSYLQTLTSTHPTEDGFFGVSVSTSGNYIIVGAEGETASSHKVAGNAYLY